MSLPCAADPLPSGKPVPSGATEISQLLISSRVAAPPTPYVADCASSAPALTTAANQTLYISHLSIRRDHPFRDAVVVKLRISAAHLDERFARRLHVAGFVRAAGLQADF